MKYEANFTDNCHQDSNNALDKKSLFNWNKNKTIKNSLSFIHVYFPLDFMISYVAVNISYIVVYYYHNNSKHIFPCSFM